MRETEEHRSQNKIMLTIEKGYKEGKKPQELEQVKEVVPHMKNYIITAVEIRMKLYVSELGGSGG